MGIFQIRSDKDSTSCPVPTPFVADASEKFIGDYTFHQFNMILSGTCTALTCVVILALMAMHAMRLSNPNEQIKIMRIASLLPLYSLFSFLSVCFPDAYVYLSGWTEFFQGIAIYTFVMLLCSFLAPNDRRRVYFASLRIPRRGNSKTTIDGLSWLQRIWFLVLQCPFVALVVAIVQCITETKGVYCLESRDTHFAHLWLNIIQIASVAVAISSIIQFCRNLRSYMEEHRPLMKLLAFKMIIRLVFLEQIIFMILHSEKVLKPTATMSYADVVIGLPTMIICIQTVPFAFFFHHAYKTEPYRVSSDAGFLNPQQYHAVSDSESGRYSPQKRYQGGPLGLYAWLALLNPLEFFREIKSTFLMLQEAET